MCRKKINDVIMMSHATCRQDRDIQEPEVIYEASDEESDNEPAPRLHLLASDSERYHSGPLSHMYVCMCVRLVRKRSWMMTSLNGEEPR